MAVGRGARNQVLDLIKRKAAILQLGRTAFRYRLQRRAGLAQGREPLVIFSEVRELSTSGDDVVIAQLFALPTAAACCQDNYLAVSHGFRIRQPKDSSIFEPRSKDLAAVTEVLRRDHKDEHASGFQPMVRVCQEHPFHGFVSTFADSPVVGRIWKRQPEGLDCAMHIGAIAVDQLIDNGGRLFRAIRIQLDPVAARTRFCGNCQERCPIPDAWIDRRNGRSWVAQAGPDSPGFGNRQREVSETEPSLISHRYSFLVAPLKAARQASLRLKDWLLSTALCVMRLIDHDEN